MKASTFAQRFEFARLFQPAGKLSDGDFAAALGAANGSVTAYKTADTPPPYDRVLAIATQCAVDPGWLAFGSLSAAPEPHGFAVWLERQHVKPARKGLFKRVPKGGDAKKRGEG